MNNDYAFKSIEQIKTMNYLIGEQFFSASSMKFFNSIIHKKVYDGKYFITSEKDDYVSHLGQRGAWDGERRYTIRMVLENGEIITFGNFGEYETLDEAKAAINKIVKTKKEK